MKIDLFGFVGFLGISQTEIVVTFGGMKPDMAFILEYTLVGKFAGRCCL